MCHTNKNQLLTLYYHEGTELEQKRIQEHVLSCKSCQDYLELLKGTEKALNKWQNEQPMPQTLDVILENISAAQLKPVQIKPVFSVIPILQIGFSVLFILSLIYIVQSKISLLPIWKSLADYWLVQVIGSFGIVAILFFCIGTFITLSLAPILVFNSQNRENFIRA